MAVLWNMSNCFYLSKVELHFYWIAAAGSCRRDWRWTRLDNDSHRIIPNKLNPFIATMGEVGGRLVCINSLWTVSALHCLRNDNPTIFSVWCRISILTMPGSHYWEGKALVSNVEQGWDIDQHMITYISIHLRSWEKIHFSFLSF